MLTPSCTYNFGTLNACNPQRMQEIVNAFIDDFEAPDCDPAIYFDRRGSQLLLLADCPSRYQVIAKDIKKKMPDILFLQELMPTTKKLKLQYNFHSNALINPSLSEICRKAQANFDKMVHGGQLLPESYELRRAKSSTNDTIGIAFNTHRFRCLTANTSSKRFDTPKKHPTPFYHTLSVKDIKTGLVLRVASCNINAESEKGKQQLATVIQTVESESNADLFVIGGNFNADFKPGIPPDPKLSLLLTAGYSYDESVIPTESRHSKVSDAIFVKVDPKGKLATVARPAFDHCQPKANGTLFPTYSDHFLTLTKVKVASKNALIPVPDLSLNDSPQSPTPSPTNHLIEFVPPTFDLDPTLVQESPSESSNASKPKQIDYSNIFKATTTPKIVSSPHLFFTSASTLEPTPKVNLQPSAIQSFIVASPLKEIPKTQETSTPLAQRKIENKTNCLCKIWHKIRDAIKAIFAYLAYCLSCCRPKKV